MELEHVGIAIRDAHSATALMKALLGEVPYKSEVVESEGVRTHFIRAGGAKLELLEALDSSSALARHLERRGQGLHHLAFEVDDLEATRDRLTGAGFTPLGEIREGADGKRIFFLHPRDTGGVLYEFCSQDRSVLTDDAVTADGHELVIRRAGSAGRVALVVPVRHLDVELLARCLEQSARVIVTENPIEVLESLDAGDGVHLIIDTERLLTIRPMAPQVRSLVLFVRGAAEVGQIDRPSLLAALPTAAAHAAALHSRLPDSDIAVGDDELLAIAVERFIRRVNARLVAGA